MRYNSIIYSINFVYNGYRIYIKKNRKIRKKKLRAKEKKKMLKIY